MERAGVHQLVDRILDVSSAAPDRDTLTGGLRELSRLLSLFESLRLDFTRELAGLSSFVEKDVADACRTDLGDAAKVVNRAETAAIVPPLAEGLAEGDVSAAHIDVVGRAMRELDESQRELLAGRGEWLVNLARSLTPREFAQRLRHEIRRLQADDGMARYERQQRNTRLRMWVDNVSGMGHLAAEFDPLTYTKLQTRLEAALATVFAEHTPAHCPSDAFAKQDFLRAHALLTLVDGGGGGTVGRPEFTVVVDTRATTTDGMPVVDLGLPVEVPWRVLVEIAGRADVHTVVVRNGIVIHAPGQLNLGRSTRLANRSQRRVLRALHPTCVIPGCEAGFEHCDIHHVIWFDDLGLTNLDNLAPVCWRHHHNIHHDGWHLTLHPDRSVTLRLPDGRILNNGPPNRSAA